MRDKSPLINHLKILDLELRKSGKSETANYFEKSIFMISQETDKKELKKLLEQLCSSGAISQYANFTHNEEQLFDKCYEEGKQLLAII